MPIHFDETKKQFHLFNESISYIMEIYRDTYLLQTYFGERIEAFTQRLPYPLKDRSSFSPNPEDWPDRSFSLDSVLQEIPGYDTGDYRESLCEFTFNDGTKAVGFTYLDHTIYPGKKNSMDFPPHMLKVVKKLIR